ncbi:flavin monoamine oxidase family protein [Almyronema epifaneia]|uniref:Flavin monoamine oxidase family protein n=1 Tax=Almyronema epifaneia S1 TaxID=2991925 RepID=A0ABW6IIQ2_9CYAN
MCSRQAAQLDPFQLKRRSPQPSTTGKTLIVGAGLAGLVVAYRLWQAGIDCEIIEASDRVGGRIHTCFNALGTGLPAELGGEVFDSDHAHCLRLIQELGLPLVDLHQQVPNYDEATYFFQGQRLEVAALAADFAPVARQAAADLLQIQPFLQQAQVTEKARALDRLSIMEYLDRLGVAAPLRDVIRVAYTIKYGCEAEEQSSLNFIGFSGTQPNTFALFGHSDERFYLQGGNEQLIHRLAAPLAASIQTVTALEALSALPEGGYCAYLRSGQRAFEKRCDRVVLTIPFSVLRQIPLRVELPERQRQAIAQLGYNHSLKLITACKHRHWQPQSALLYSDLPFQHIWETTASLHSPQMGLLTNYTGGQQSLRHLSETPEAQARQLIQQLEQVFPGIQAVHQPQAVLRSDWLTNPYTQGAYTCYRVGQWTQFYGAEGQRTDNLFFAGEHCSSQYQGYMEGACETAERVAAAILQDLSLSPPALKPFNA